ncbi:MAG: helix-turn-helix transcriptional regulator [Pirellulaceae bacterium]
MSRRIGIADALRKGIKATGETLYRVAEDSGVDYAVLHRFVNDGTNIAVSNAEKLAEYLGLELQPRRRKGR